MPCYWAKPTGSRSQHLERWPRGLWRRFAKPVYSQGYRGFESRPFRQTSWSDGREAYGTSLESWRAREGTGGSNPPRSAAEFHDGGASRLATAPALSPGERRALRVRIPLPPQRRKPRTRTQQTDDGDVAERLMAPVSKTDVGETPPGVRIPPSPPCRCSSAGQSASLPRKRPRVRIPLPAQRSREQR